MEAKEGTNRSLEDYVEQLKRCKTNMDYEENNIHFVVRSILAIGCSSFDKFQAEKEGKSVFAA